MVVDSEFHQRRVDMLKGTIERRGFSAGGIECRALDDGSPVLRMLNSRSETPYEVGDPKRGGFWETMARDAWTRTLAENPDVVLLLDHSGPPHARTTIKPPAIGSLWLRQTDRGLESEAVLDPDDPDSMALARRVANGLLNQCSFSFRCTADSWDDTRTHRRVLSVTMAKSDVSVVAFGANDQTSVEVLAARAAEQLSAGAVGAEQRSRERLIVMQARETLAERARRSMLMTPAERSTDWYRSRLGELRSR